MDEPEPMRVASVKSPTATVDPADTGSKFWDWFLFGLTLVGAAVVYISVYMTSAIGFVVGEAICLSVALVGLAIKYWRKWHVTAGGGLRRTK